MKRNTILGLQHVAEQGCFPGGQIAKGYTYSHKQIGYYRDEMPRSGRKPEIDPVIAPLVMVAFEMKALGATNSAISKATGLYGPKSSSWSYFFRNQVYIGKYEFQGQIYRDVYPPLISEELFDCVQKIITGNNRKKDSVDPNPAI